MGAEAAFVRNGSVSTADFRRNTATQHAVAVPRSDTVCVCVQ